MAQVAVEAQPADDGLAVRIRGRTRRISRDRAVKQADHQAGQPQGDRGGTPGPDPALSGLQPGLEPEGGAATGHGGVGSAAMFFQGNHFPAKVHEVLVFEGPGFQEGKISLHLFQPQTDRFHGGTIAARHGFVQTLPPARLYPGGIQDTLGGMKPVHSGPAMFVSFLRIGTFTLGGGLAMLPLIEREFVVKRQWVSEAEMPELLAVAQSLPGVIAINASIMVGYHVNRWRGALWAAAGMVLPSFLIILVVARFLGDLREVELVARAFAGVRAAMAGLLLASAIRMGRRVVQDLRSLLVCLLAFLALGLLDLDFMVVLAGAALSGLAAWGFGQVVRKGRAGTKVRRTPGKKSGREDNDDPA